MRERKVKSNGNGSGDGHGGDGHGGGGHGGDHGAHAGHDVETFRRRFWVCLILTIPVLAYSEHVQNLLGFRPPPVPGGQFIPPVLGTIIYLYGGMIFLRGLVREISQRLPGMMTLIGIAITVAFLYSAADALGLVVGELWWELSTLVVVMLLGHWIEMRSIGRAGGALQELAALLPDEAERITGDQVEKVPVESLRPGDLLLVRPGASVPADGEVVGGDSELNESMVTGESRPVSKGTGDRVTGGTINGSGSLRVEVASTGGESTLGGIMRLVEEAQASRSRSQDLTDRAALVLTIIALGGGLITLLVWLGLGESVAFALERTVTVMVIACPHALGLAIPLVVAISTTIAARNGLLVRRREAFERSRKLDTVVFDKTGTLTTGEFGVVGVAVAEGAALDEEQLLSLAAAVEADSEHVMARAVVEEARKRGLSLPQAEDFRALTGKGVEARVEGRRVVVGRMEGGDGEGDRGEGGDSVDDGLRRFAAEAASDGQSVVQVVVDGKPVGAISLADVIRPESYGAVRSLKEQGLQVVMITGDGEDVARWVSGELGIDEYFARVLPDQKTERIEELKGRNRRVAMVGDGVNDAPALVAADVGFAIGAGTNVAVEAGDIVLVRNDPRDIGRVVQLSRATYRKMLQNIAWATGYNVVALPLAAGVLAGYGVVLAPAVGAVLMSASTVVVAINAQLLRNVGKKLGVGVEPGAEESGGHH